SRNGKELKIFRIGPKDDVHIGKVHRKSFPKNATRRATEKLFAISYANIIFATYAEYLQLFAISALEDSVLVEELKQESLQLSKQNEELVKEVDHIQEGRCSDVDKVAYLKWINACLRYELRNYQSALGETTARDLSKTLSPESSKKAKKLVVEYAAKEDQGDRGIHVLELDSYQLSSQEPHLMNSGEFDGTSISNSLAHKTDTSNKSKIFRKLMRVIRGKDHHHNHSEMAHNTEENAARCSYYSSGYCLDMYVIDTGAIRPQTRSRTPSPGSFKQFIDFHSFDQGSTTNKGESRNYPTRIMRYSDVGLLYYMSKHLAESPQEKGNNHDQEDVHKAELAKYAEVLKGSL
ncbi:hypothetical protein MTR67_044903, partial [Solanum verrucosum]